LLVDLNADLGEGVGSDAELMPLITSANIACGGHAGDEATMRQALQLARDHGVRVGAHPGYPDREHFGRRELQLPPSEVTRLCRDQISALQVQAKQVGVALAYVKPHGALYNQGCREAELAAAIVAAAREFHLPVMGLPGSQLEATARAAGIPYLREGFADRRYQADGTLVPRSQPEAMITDPDEAADQVKRLVRDWGVDSVCVHGDAPGVVSFTSALRQRLRRMASGRP
jgi:UPF0271 protein